MEEGHMINTATQVSEPRMDGTTRREQLETQAMTPEDRPTHERLAALIRTMAHQRQSGHGAHPDSALGQVRTVFEEVDHDAGHAIARMPFGQ